MKKFLSLVLAAMMVLTCTAAMATSLSAAPADADVIDGIKDVSELVVVDEAPAHFKVDAANNSATQKTDLWLQVDASGQIDVTVPLVLVFKTNIDGGDATEATNYLIKNNNNTNLVVTKINVTPNSDGAVNPMDLVDNTQATLNDDEYYVTLFAQPDEVGTGDVTEFNLNDGLFEETAKNGGLFKLNRATTGGADPTDTIIEVYMKTGKLTFVTTRTDDDSAMDMDKGVHLLSIEYTVGINTESQYGDDISNEKSLWGKDNHEGTTYDADGEQVDMNLSYSSTNGTVTVTEAAATTGGTGNP